MAYDKVVDSVALDNELKTVGDAIRGKNGESKQYSIAEMATAIASLTASGGNLNPEGVMNPQDYEVVVVQRLPDGEPGIDLPGIDPGSKDAYPFIFPNWKDYVGDINRIAGFVYWYADCIRFYLPQAGLEAMVHEKNPEIKQFNLGEMNFIQPRQQYEGFNTDMDTVLFTPHGLAFFMSGKRDFSNGYDNYYRRRVNGIEKDGMMFFLKKGV